MAFIQGGIWDVGCGLFRVPIFRGGSSRSEIALPYELHCACKKANDARLVRKHGSLLLPIAHVQDLRKVE